MSFKLYSLIFTFAILLFISFAETRNVFERQDEEPEIEFVTRPPGVRRTIGDQFRDWAKIVSNFFTDGKWGEGGPQDLAKFIGNTVRKVINLLMNEES